MRRQIPPGVRTRVSPVRHGLEALMRRECGQVCHWLMVSSYCTPGSAQHLLAARRVVPPDLIAPAARSPIFRKLIRPEDFPPPERASSSPRSLEKLDPVPEPYLNSRASRVHKSMIPPGLTRSSLMD